MHIIAVRSICRARAAWLQLTGSSVASCKLTDRALPGQIGPVTNVGTLLQLHPELAPRVQSIVMVAARRPGQSFVSSQGNGQQQTPHPDLNFDCDVDAMRLLLDTEVPLAFAPWEVSDKVWLTRDDLDALARTESEAAQYLAHHSRSWLESWVSNIGFAGFDGGHRFGGLPAAPETAE